MIIFYCIRYNINYYYYVGGGQPCRDPALRHPRDHFPQPGEGPEVLTWSHVHNQVSPQWSLYRVMQSDNTSDVSWSPLMAQIFSGSRPRRRDRGPTFQVKIYLFTYEWVRKKNKFFFFFMRIIIELHHIFPRKTHFHIFPLDTSFPG